MTVEAAKVESVMIDCRDVDALVPFWSEILGIEERVRYPGYVWLGRAVKGGPALAFQQVPEAKAVKNRVHLDLQHSDPEAFIARVEALGGKRLDDHEAGGFRWSVLADPEGNEFCITKSE